MAQESTWLQRCSDAELADLEKRVGAPKEGALGTAAAMYLVFVPALLVMLLLERAAERSATWEIVAWLVLAVSCVPAYAKHRNVTAQRELWVALIVEKHRRQ